MSTGLCPLATIIIMAAREIPRCNSSECLWGELGDRHHFCHSLESLWQYQPVGWAEVYCPTHIVSDDGKQMRYRRSQTPGATFFFTVVTYERKKILCLGENPRLLRQAFETVKAKYPLIVDAIVLLPDHLHCLWTLPPGDNEYSKRWMLIKSNFTRICHDPFESRQRASRTAKREQYIWQRRFGSIRHKMIWIIYGMSNTYITIPLNMV